MRYSSTIGAAPARLGIMPGGVCALACTASHDLFGRMLLTLPINVHAAVDGARTALPASTHKTAARLFCSFDQVGPVHDTADFGDNRRIHACGVLIGTGDAEPGGVPMHAVRSRLSDTLGVFHQLMSDLGQHDDEAVISSSENSLRDRIQFSYASFRHPTVAAISS